MFSKRLIRKGLVLLIISTISLAGCESKVGEQPPPAENQEFAGANCLSEMNPVAKAFIQGTAKKEEVISAWNCVSGAVEKFKRYVRGRTADRYTSQELATFLERNFLEKSTPSRKISPTLQKEFMKLKQVFIGGSDEYISRDEIDKLIVFFGNLRTMTVNLNPYMKVFSLNWSLSEANSLQVEARYFEDANREIQSAAKTLASLIEKTGASYKLSDFVALTENLGLFFDEHWEFPKTIAKYMPVVKKVKKALAGGDENTISPSEWRRFALLGARGYVQFLRYYYFIKSVPETGSGYRLSYLSRTFEDVLSVLQDLVAEKPEGIVSRDEVTDLLKTLQVVWPDFKVSNSLVFEAMKLKQLFFGGSSDSFTTVDFGTARLKVNRIKILVERFLPFYSIYGREWEPELYEPEEAQKIFMESQSVLEATVREAGMLFEGSYDLNEIISLTREIEALYPSPDGKSWEEAARKVLPPVIDVKNMILGGEDSVLRKSEWSVLLGFASRFYTDFLYHHYFVREQPLDQPLTVSNLSVLANQTLNIFSDLLVVKKDNHFSRGELNKIARHLMDLEILPKGVSAGALDSFIGVVLNNFLVTPEARIAGYTPNVFNANSVQVLRQELQIWLDAELYVTRLTQGWGPREGIKSEELIDTLTKAQGEDTTSSFLQAALREFLLSVRSPFPVTVDGQGHVIITTQSQPLYTAQGLRQLNLNRALSRVLIRSFATSQERIQTYAGVNLAEVEGGFVAVKPFFAELGFLDPKNSTFASSRFREANIFVPHSDGSNLASMAEVTDLIGMIWSGVNVNSLLRKELIRICFAGVDQNESAVVSLSCARKAYKEAMPSVMLATPDYLDFMRTVSKDEWAYYMNNIFKSAGYIPNENNIAALADIELAPHVIQYVEMIYARFDKNKDGIISTSESLKAFPSFKGILLELAKDEIASGSIKEKDLLSLFTYILRYGKPPETIREKLRFALKWRGKPANWDVWADRVQMSQILGYIADQVNKSQVNQSNTF